jgi:hypothetical protein
MGIPMAGAMEGSIQYSLEPFSLCGGESRGARTIPLSFLLTMINHLFVVTFTPAEWFKGLHRNSTSIQQCSSQFSMKPSASAPSRFEDGKLGRGFW